VRRLAAWIEAFAMGLGGPGLFLVAFLDSSFLSLPQIVDLLLIWMVIRHKERMVFYALMATAGSVAGCLALYSVGRKGGEAFLRRRVKERHLARGLVTFNRYGVLAVAVPSVLPPPMPFKLFVLLAGAARVPIWQFVAAVSGGRAFRYFGQALLAAWYGEQAIEFIALHATTVSWLVAGLILVAGTLWLLHRRRRGETPRLG
jgi:membrane protein YqaA with SNARE-associated domain